MYLYINTKETLYCLMDNNLKGINEDIFMF